MLRRSPIQRRTPLRRRWEGPTVGEREPRPMARLERVPNYAGSTTGPAPKDGVVESAAYENAVRALGFCVRCGWTGRPQFCHRDEGKGAGIKTDVRQGWAGCDDCHALLGGHKGGGRMPKEQRRDEEDRLAAITRAELLRRGLWPKNVPMWEE
jgi:hypothetical protein